ncbi:MAG: hypothetical protein HY217_07330 [Candidatus Rokubacteria bacterium]|nr:hypothetical protein [Candidatus Rokubacteria bacterium]
MKYRVPIGRFRLVLLLLSLAVVLSAPPAVAQNGGPQAEPLILAPDGVVDVRHLPPAAHVPAGGTRPVHFPDLNLLIQHKEQLQKGGGIAPAPPPTTTISPTAPSLQLPLGSIQGLQQSDAGGYYPPDTQIAAGAVSGSTYLFETVNLEGRIWSPGGVTTFDLCSFFGVSCAFLSDPKIRFDPDSGRWFVAAITYQTPTGTWLLAVSTSSDPTSTYARYTIPSARSTFPDFPALGISGDKVVLTANGFNPGGVFKGTEFVVLNKSQLVAAQTVYGQFYGPPQGLFTIQPAFALPDGSGAVSSPLYMAAVAFNSATSIRIWQVTGVPSAGSLATVSVLGTLSIPTLSTPPNAQQAGTSALIATNDNRLLEAVYRNGVLWVSANSACTPNGDTATRACLRFMQLQISTVSVLQALDVGDVGIYYFYPAIQIDANNNLVSVFSGSSASGFASVYASGQSSPGTFGTVTLIQSGQGPYAPNTARWGDYSGAAIDPSGTTVWVAGEYALAGNQWGTWIAEVGF